MSFSQTSKVGLMLFIFWHMASQQRVLPFSSSNDFAACTDFEILTPNLCVRNQYFDFSFTIMRLRFSSACRTHHTNTGWYEIRHCNAYSSIYTGYEFCISLRVTNVVLPYLHWVRNSTPFSVSLRRFVPVCVVMNSSWYFN